MKQLFILFAFVFSTVSLVLGQCALNTSASQLTIACGETVTLSTSGQGVGTIVLEEDFNSGGFGAGWSSTPGSVEFNNPCSPGDGTPHAWMGSTTSVPRTITTVGYDLTAATAGVTVCFDLLFATQGQAAPCEGPDEPDEGVFLQYSIDGGTTWVTIHYFDPNGGFDPQLTNWNNYCFDLPPGAITGNTMIRWTQTSDSGAQYDHWGIDNVQFFQNDLNSEIIWLHDGYSYGVGNSGGPNPTDVQPTSTTTYTSQITTGNGDVCTSDITITVIDPFFDISLEANPNPICEGDCADIIGDAFIMSDPGGIVTYENNQFAPVITGGASININVQGLNMTTVNPGSILEVCVNSFNFSGNEVCTSFGGCNCNGATIGFGSVCNVDVSSFNITLTSPNGCEIVLVPSGEITSTGIQNMCFVPAGGSNISTGGGNYSGTWDPSQPISNLDGCDANGVWNLEFNTGIGGLGFGLGTLTGWNITFDNPPVYQDPFYSWSPAAGLSDPTSANPTACPTETTTYTLTTSNGVPGCAVNETPLTIVVDPCDDCVPPSLDIEDLITCINPSVDLNDAILPTSDAAIISFHNTQADAQNNVNPIANVVGTSGSFWIRAEDPLDPTCFLVYEIIVSISSIGYTEVVVDENCGNLDGSITLTGLDGTAPYSYSIDNGATSQGSETFVNVAAGIYNVVIIDDNGCEATGTVNVNNIGGPSINQLNTTNPTCNGACDGQIVVVVSGGALPYAYQWFDAGGNPIGADFDLINGLCAGDYSVQVSDDGGLCPVTASTTLQDPAIDDASFILTDFCEGEANSASGTVTPGGTFTFNPAPGDGASINAGTGEITNGVGGTTYTVQYETPGACPQISSETVNVIASPTFNLAQTNPSCGGSDGIIIISGLLPNTSYDVIYSDGAVVGPQNMSSDAAGVIIIDNLPSGAYTSFELTLNGCSTLDNSIINLVQDGAPAMTAPADMNICIGESITLTALNPDGAVISWDNGVVDGVSFIPGGVGVITYTVTAELNGCSVTDEVNITVNALPVVDAGTDQVICGGDQVVLSASGAQSYVWDNGVINGVGFVPDNTTTYTVTGTDANGCVGEDDVLITVSDQQIADFSAGPVTGCGPLLVNFVNLSGANNASCIWNLGDGTIIVGCDNFSHVYESVGNYSVTLTVESLDGCTNSFTATDYISVTAPPVAMFSADPQVTDIYNTFINFTNESIGGEEFTWSFGDGSENEIGYNASHEYSSEAGGTYIVTLVASSGEGCRDTISLVVQINDDLIFYVPNTFTPDEDPFNPIFIPIFGSGLDASDYKLIIFNRWGEVVFETRDVFEGWNGTYRGQPVKDGTYVWTLEFLETMSDKRHKYNGHVNVLR